MQSHLILASNSKRRHQILDKVGIRHTIRPSNFDEETIPLHLSVEQYSLEVALAKGRVFASTHPDEWILSADTSVYFENTHLNKPKSLDEAHEMLSRLQGKTHLVCSAMALFHQGKVFSAVDITQVFFKPITSDWIRYYHTTIDVLDAAGSYMIDNLSALFIEKIEGTLESVMGLPIHRLENLIENHGGKLCNFTKFSPPLP
ncbi:MAG: Maf family protein [Chlamydiia bacterium]